MNENNTITQVTRLSNALRAGDASARLQAALTAGIHADDAYLSVLIDRCGVEPDFYVRDMLTWAITRHDRTQAVDLLLPEHGSVSPQACSQALHSLSKLHDPRAWQAITTDLLRDADEEVVKTAWRTAAGLAPESERVELARELGRNFGRDDGELRRSLNRAIAMLGPTAEQVVEEASESRDPDVRARAFATAHVMAHPDDSFEAAIVAARRVVALRAAPTIEEG